MRRCESILSFTLDFVLGIGNAAGPLIIQYPCEDIQHGGPFSTSYRHAVAHDLDEDFPSTAVDTVSVMLIPFLAPLFRSLRRRRRELLTVAATLLLVLSFLSSDEPPEGTGEFTIVELDPAQVPNWEKDANNSQPLVLWASPASTSSSPSPMVFSPGIPKQPGEAYTKALVIARTKAEDVDWVFEPYDNEKHCLSDEWDLFVYATDDPTPDEFRTPINKGREVMVYLTYLIDHYDHLPDITLFLHAHRNSWHDNLFSLDTPSAIARLSLDRVARLGFANLRCSWRPGCPAWINPARTERDDFKQEEAVMAAAWRDLFPRNPLPVALAQPCCAQFGLSRERARVRSRAWYVAARDWLLHTELEDAISGRVWEYLYQFVWTGEAVVCPAEHECYCEGYGVCFGGEERFKEVTDRREERDGLQQGIEDVQRRMEKTFSADHVLSLVERARQREGGLSGGDAGAVYAQQVLELSRHKADHSGDEGMPDEGVEKPGDDEVFKLVEHSRRVKDLDLWLADAIGKAKKRGMETRTRPSEKVGKIDERTS